MTTVIYHDGFLITDKRMTASKRNMSKHLIDQDITKSMLDHSVKICVEPFVRKLTHKGNRVMALAHAGSVQGYEDVEAFLKKSSITLLSDVAALGVFFSTLRDIALLAVLEDGSFCTILLDGSGSLTEARNDPTFLGMLGSGQKFYDPLLHTLLTSKALTLEEVFLYMASRDPNTSVDYSVYSLNEDKLFTCVALKHADYGPKAKKVHQALEALFERRKVKHYGN